MSLLEQIAMVQFRNYTDNNFLFQDRVSCITGSNGSGKTNLLDAVYYLCFTKSYFTATQQNCVQSGKDGFRLSGTFEDGEIITCRWQAGKKEVACNGVAYEKITDHIGRYSAVMVAPDDIDLINGGSEGRRKWLDGILSQCDHLYLEKLLQYQNALAQRNAWLKAEATKPRGQFAETGYYDNMLSVCGSYLFQQRCSFFAGFKDVFFRFYQRLSQGADQVLMVYQSELLHTPMHQLLQNGLEHDLRLQRTTRGIHKDDIVFHINGLPARQFASQGQKKSLLFSLKLAQHEYLSKVLQRHPILLLDDIFEKLDQRRLEALMEIISGSGFGQVILSDTHPERIARAFSSGGAPTPALIRL